MIHSADDSGYDGSTSNGIIGEVLMMLDVEKLMTAVVISEVAGDWVWTTVGAGMHDIEYLR